MPRKARAEEPGGTYHVTARGNGGQAIFVDDFDRLYWLQLVTGVVSANHWQCFAYCLMDTHYHLLVEIDEANLALGMQELQTRFAQRFNGRHGRSGHVFGDRYHSRRVESDEHLLATLVYIVLNPVRAGAASTPHAWFWSSFRATAGLAGPETFLAIDRVLDLLSPNRARARRRFRQLVDEAWGLSPTGDSPPLPPLSTRPVV